MKEKETNDIDYSEKHITNEIKREMSSLLKIVLSISLLILIFTLIQSLL